MDATTILTEVQDLACEIFSTVYGADWGHAITIAVNDLPSLIAYATDWDAEIGPVAADAGDWDTAFAALLSGRN